MTSPKLLVVGDLRQDYLITHENRAHSGVLGGSAAHAAAGARLWSNSVGIMARVGDSFPESLLRGIQAAGIEMDLARSHHPTGRRAFYAYSAPREMAEGNPAAHYLRIGQTLPKELVDLKPLDRSEAVTPLPGDHTATVGTETYVHLSPAGLPIQSAWMVHLREHAAGMISLDPDDESMQPGQLSALEVLINGLNVMIASEQQLRALFQPSPPPPREMAERLTRMGCDVIVVRRGAHGAYVWDLGRSGMWQIPCYPVRIQDVTGEAHAFAGGVLAGMADTGDPLEATLRGCVSASFCIEGVGALYPLDCAPGLAHARLDSLRVSAKEI